MGFEDGKVYHLRSTLSPSQILSMDYQPNCRGGIITTPALCLFTIYHATEFDMTSVLFAVYFGIVATFDYTLSMVMFWYCEDTAIAFGRMKLILQRLIAHETYERNSKIRGKVEWKIMGNVIKLIALELVFLAFTLLIVLVMEQLDPLHNVLQYFLGSCSPNISYAVRQVLSTLFVSEADRVYGSFIVLMFHWLEMLPFTSAGFTRFP